MTDDILKPAIDEIERDALLSDDGRYRYMLKRQWDPSCWRLAIIMLNPSIADSTLDDPTIRRCMSFAKRDGWGGITVLNLYAYRTPKPAYLFGAVDPIGPDNDATIAGILRVRADYRMPVLAAWGAHARPDRVDTVMNLEPRTRFVSLGTTNGGHPRHPLYVKGDTPFEPFPNIPPVRMSQCPDSPNPCYHPFH